MTNSALPAVDHLIWVVPDLARGMDEIERRLGVRPAVGGRHTDLGSHNALLALGESTYLEIMAADPNLPRPARGRLFGLDELEAPRLATWVLRCEAIERQAEHAAGEGLDLGAIHAGSRERPDGTVVSWKITDPYASRLQGVVPFLIAWGDTPHPARSAPGAGRLTALRIEHPEPDAVRAALSFLGVMLPVRHGLEPGLVATIAGPRGDVDLGQSQAPSRAGVKLVPTPIEHLPLLQRWFPDGEAAFRWGGPGLRYPFTDATFQEDIRWGRMASWSLVDSTDVLVGFGQYYLNHGRCHLARLAVDPARRGMGLGRRLVDELIQVGLRDLGVEECSLFVLNDNRPAIRCYRALGFAPRPFPDWQPPFGDGNFMVRPAGVDGQATSA